MDLELTLCAFGICSFSYAAARYLNELCIYLDNAGRSQLLQKILLIFVVVFSVFSIPALIVFYPLQSLLLKRMEKFYRKDERESMKALLRGDIKSAVRKEHERMKSLQEMAVNDARTKSRDTAIQIMSEKCEQCPYKKDYS